jgi:hypothetical protein
VRPLFISWTCGACASWNSLPRDVRTKLDTKLRTKLDTRQRVACAVVWGDAARETAALGVRERGRRGRAAADLSAVTAQLSARVVKRNLVERLDLS